MPSSTVDRDDRSRQKRVGEAVREETRSRLVDAAETEFAAHGYAATTVTKLAAAAGVSVQTLYLAWGSKRALLRASMERALAGNAASPDAAAARFTPDLSPGERLDLLADLVTEVARRAAIGWRLYRDAAAVDPEIAADWDDLQSRRHGLFTHAVGAIAVDALAPGLSTASAIDTAWAIASPESYELLVTRRGYSLEEFREWMRGTLRRGVLP